MQRTMINLSNIKEFLNLHKGEERMVSLLMLYSFFQTFALALFFTAASAIFLSEYSIYRLPAVYISASVLLLLINFFYFRLTRFIPARKLMLAEVGVLFISILLFRLGFAYANIAWLAFGLIIWHRVMGVYMVAGFMRLTLILFDVRQSKRLSGLVSSTEVPASITGYLLTSVLAPLIGTSNLLWLSAAGLLLALVFLFRLVADRQAFSFQESEIGIRRKNMPEPGSSFMKKFFRNRFIYALSVTCFLAVFTFTLVEYAFLSQVNARFSDQTKIAYFLGLILGSGQVVAFFIKTLFYSHILRRFGIQVALFILPFALALFTLAAVSGNLFSSESFLVVWIWVIIMLINDTLKSALYSSTFTSLLQPLAQKLKLIGHDILGNIEAVAIGICGLVLLGLQLSEANTLLHFSLVLLVGITGWIFSIRVLNHRYIFTLEKALKQRLLEGSTIQLDDAQTQQLLKEKLDSRHPGEVLYALDILCKGNSVALPELLGNMLSHPSEEVRKEVLKRIETLKLVSLQSKVRERLQHEGNLALKKLAIRVYCVLGEAAVVDEVSNFLEDPEEEIQTGAIVGLICFGGINGIILAGHKLNEYVYSPTPGKRAFAAEVVGEVGIPNFYHPLLNLVEDEHVMVRRSALRAAGKIKHPKLYPYLLRAVSSPQVFETAVQSLIQTGEEVISLFETELEKPDNNPVRLRRLITVCGKIGGTKAINLLRNNLDFKNIEVRNQILQSLSLCRYSPRSSEKDQVLTAIHRELSDATWFVNCLESISQVDSQFHRKWYKYLEDAMKLELHYLKRRLLLLLSYIYNANDVLQVWESLQTGNKESKANALEVLDVLVAKDLSSVILPLLEDYPVSQLVKILNNRFPQPKLTVYACMQKLISRREEPVVNIWTQAISLYTVRQMLIEPLINEVILAASHPNKLVAETALWALQGFYPDNYQSFLSSIENVPLLRMKEKMDHEVTQNKLLAIEKVMALKTTSIFKETMEDILVDIASILQEVQVKQGECIFEKNDLGTCMYIIYEGLVKVHDGEFTFAELKTRDFFGELSLLDTEPRSASVTAISDSLLLRLDQHAFYEIMADRTEVTREIMKILCRRLRFQNQLVAHMKEQLHRTVKVKD